jgi:hypothetical protein
VGVAGEVVLQSVEQADKAVGLGVTGIVGRRGANRSHR